MPFTGPLQIEMQDVRTTSTSKQHTLGTLAVTRDGRQFRYGQAGAVALTAGKMHQIPAVIANHQALVTLAAAVNATKITVTLGGTAATADQYIDGYAIIRDTSTTGAGQAFPISGNSAQTVTTGNADIYITEGVAEALTSASVTNLELSPYGGVLITTTADTTESCIGVPQIDTAAASYCWFQVRGVAAVLANGTITKGAGVIKSATTAGAVDIEAAATITQRVGIQLQTGTTAKYNTTMLTIG
jgi:hypothetical protein